MDLMVMATKRTAALKALELAEKRLQTLQDNKNKLQAQLDNFNKMIAQEVTSGSTKASSPVKVDMAKLYEEHGHRFNANSWTEMLAISMAEGYFKPNRKGVYTVLDARQHAIDTNREEDWGFAKISYMTIWTAMRRIANVYGLAWPTHSAGMKVS